MGSSASMPQGVLLVGLEGAGKTTMLYEVCSSVSIPSESWFYSIESGTYNDFKLLSWDVDVQEKVKQLRKTHYRNGQISGIIFLVDSLNFDRIEEAKSELAWLSKEEALLKLPVLVLASKQDLPNCYSVSDISSLLELDGLLEKRPWKIYGTGLATMKQDVEEPFNWLRQAIENPEGHIRTKDCASSVKSANKV